MHLYFPGWVPKNLDPVVILSAQISGRAGGENSTIVYPRASSHEQLLSSFSVHELAVRM